MQGFILEGLNNPKLDLTKILESKDMEINTYLQYCQNIVYKLRNVSSKYSSISEMLADAEEFKKILVNPLAKDEVALNKIYRSIVDYMEKQSSFLKNRLREIEEVIDLLPADCRDPVFGQAAAGTDGAVRSGGDHGGGGSGIHLHAGS